MNLRLKWISVKIWSFPQIKHLYDFRSLEIQSISHMDQVISNFLMPQNPNYDVRDPFKNKNI